MATHRSRRRLSPSVESDRLTQFVDAALIVALIGVPLSMGGLTAARYLALAVAAGLALFAISLRALLRRDDSLQATGFEWLLIAGAAVIAVQLAPLPSEWIERLSPNLQKMLPLWGGPRDPEEMGVWSTLSVTPAATLVGLTSFLACGILFFAVCNRIRRVEDAERCLKWVAAATVAIAVVGLLQFFAGNGKFLWVYEHPEANANFPAKGPFPNRNHFAGFLAMGFGTVLALALAKPSEGKERGSRKSGGFGVRSTHGASPAYWIAACVVALAVLLSLSRGGLVAFVAAGGLFALIQWRTTGLGWKSAAGLVACAGVVVAALSIYGFDRVSSRIGDVASADASRLDKKNARIDIWRANVAALRDFPIFGTGVGSHRDVYRRYLPTPRDIEFQYAESTFLQIGTETGLAGLALTALGMLIVLVRAARGIARASTPAIARCQSAAFAGLAGGALHACVDFTWYSPGCIVAVIFLAAVVLRLHQIERDTREPESEREIIAPPVLLRFGALAAGVVLCVWIAGTKWPAVAAEPHWNRYFVLARSPELAGEGEDAAWERLTSLREAVKADPHHARAHLRLSLEYLTYFNAAQAESENAMFLPQLREAALASDFETHDELRAWVDQAIGENLKLLDAGAHHARRALSLAPCQAHGYLYLSELAFLSPTQHTKKSAEGRSRIRENSDIEDAAPTDEDRNLTISATEESSATAGYLEQARRIDPQDGFVLIATGQEAFMAGKVDEAFACWKAAYHRNDFCRAQIVELLAGAVEPQFLLDRLEPDWDGLVALRRKYEALGDPEQSAVILTRYAEAAEERAATLAERDAAQLLLSAAEAWKKRESPERCLETLKKALELDPNSFEVRFALGSWHYEQAQYAEASEHLAWCSRRHPRDGRVRRMADDAYRQQSQRTSLLSPVRQAGYEQPQPDRDAARK